MAGTCLGTSMSCYSSTPTSFSLSFGNTAGWFEVMKPKMGPSSGKAEIISGEQDKTAKGTNE